MTYSQKYCLVHFIEPIDSGAQFHMSSWPLHITVADVFAIDRVKSNVDTALQNLCEQRESVAVTGTEESVLGTTPVTLISTTPKLLELHSDIVTLLEKCGATFNTPAYNKEGFIPHSSIQGDAKMTIGEEITINSLSLIDMFPESDWEQRRVLATFYLRESH